MRPSLRFLVLALVGWAGIRSATLGILPGAQIFRVSRGEAAAPPIVPTQFPPIDPIAPAPENAAAADFQAAAAPVTQFAAPQSAPRGAVGPVYYVPASLPESAQPRVISADLPAPRPQFYAPIPALNEWPLSSLASAAYQPLRSTVVTPAQSLPAAIKQRGIDRIQMSAWALLRAQQTGIAGGHSLGNNGSLGASQAGARILYNLTSQLAAMFLSSSDVGRRGGELAAGVRIQPARGIPVWVTAERRQRIGQYGNGRNAFALLAEAGVYDRPMPLHLSMDAYLQAGVVGFHSRDRFIDGALTLTRPLYKQFSAGLGVWGGAQPGLYRLDAGPRVTMRVRGNVRVHFDWRQRLAGNAAPGSGPAVTLAGDF